jgi:hypothetical protein
MSVIESSTYVIDAAQTRWLHSRCQHPEFEYEETSGPRKQDWGKNNPPEGDGWEKNLAWGDDGFERFSMHEEVCWRRQIEEKEIDIPSRDLRFDRSGSVAFFLEMRNVGSNSWLRCGECKDEGHRKLIVELQRKAAGDAVNDVKLDYRIVKVVNEIIYNLPHSKG